jgi:hypothetical protein
VCQDLLPPEAVAEYILPKTISLLSPKQVLFCFNQLVTCSLLQQFGSPTLASQESFDQAWVDTLLCAVNILPVSHLSQVVYSLTFSSGGSNTHVAVMVQVVPFAISKGSPSETVQGRVIACKTLGKLATRLPINTVTDSSSAGGSPYFQTAMMLCQDISWEVRSAMADQLASIAKAVQYAPMIRDGLFPVYCLNNSHFLGTHIATL